MDDLNIDLIDDTVEDLSDGISEDACDVIDEDTDVNDSDTAAYIDEFEEISEIEKEKWTVETPAISLFTENHKRFGRVCKNGHERVRL